MKTLYVVLEKAKDGYGVWIDEFPNVFSFGKTVEEAKKNIRTALEYAFEDVVEKPLWLSDGFEIDVRCSTTNPIQFNLTPCSSPLYPATPY
ncbi:MAG: type II toxin-antitoxin system HicB family antitoxin [Prevotellaceae bacterium]|jgi:predicted RNase H-like HicB family nuclease|nr:type II toxin-antitoxin system HicB family antitoxin [Prevotellaceae bacterium]